MADVTPYSTAVPYFGQLPTWMTEMDAQRVSSYAVYENMYQNVPESFKLVFRGSEDNPIYVPSGKLIVDTVGRYVGKGFGFKVDPAAGSPAEQLLAIEAFGSLFKRERFVSKFHSNKRFGLIRGDWCFHITADPAKPEGTRLTITPLDPASYFPIYNPDNIDQMWGADIVEQVSINDRSYIKRQRYLKSDHPDRDGVPGGAVSVQIDILEVEGWNTTSPKFYQRNVLPFTVLPPEITAVPIYHIRNNEEPQNPFGSSEMRGLERMMTAVNQAISDEEIALALEGLGMYATDGGSPIDENGDETEWALGPGKVVEIGAGRSFTRVNGIGTVGPFQDHIAYLEAKLRETAPLPDVAVGKVDVNVAESGVSLALQMAPILDASEVKDLAIQDVMNQMLFDLRNWLKIYEGVNLDNVGVECAFGQKLPVNRKERMAELQDLYANGVISTKFYRDTLVSEFGFVFPESMEQEIEAERAAADPYADRLGEEGVIEDVVE